MPRFLITVEGGEGSGKSTLIAALSKYLTENRALFVVTTFEPGATVLGEKIRELLLYQEEILISKKAELLLFLADRAQHVETLVKPALEEDLVVLCDRFTDSSIAYQGASFTPFSIDAIEEVCLFAAGGLVPDLTLFLDIDPQMGLNRIQRKKDRIEKEEIQFHKQVRSSYLLLAKKHPYRIVTLDGSIPPEELLKQAIEVVDARLP